MRFKKTQNIFWEVRKGDISYNYPVPVKAATIENRGPGKPRNHLDGYLEEARDSLTPLGSLKKHLSEIGLESFTIWKEGSVIHLAKGPDQISVEDMGNQQYQLRSFEQDSPNIPQFEKTSVEEYATFGTDTLPAKVRVVLFNKSGNVTWLYTVKAVHYGGEVMKVPFVNDPLPVLQINDERFTPSSQYRIISALPDDEQIAEWIKKPAELEAYNRKMWTAYPW